MHESRVMHTTQYTTSAKHEWCIGWYALRVMTDECIDYAARVMSDVLFNTPRANFAVVSLLYKDWNFGRHFVIFHKKLVKWRQNPLTCAHRL